VTGLSRNMIIVVMVLLVVGFFAYNYISNDDGPEAVTASEVVTLFNENGGVVSIEGDTLTAEIDGKQYEATVTDDFDASQFLPEALDDSRLTIGYETTVSESGESGWGSSLISLLPILVIGAVAVWMLRRRTSQAPQGPQGPPEQQP
jgi:ATP-dependent Zn protease